MDFRGLNGCSPSIHRSIQNHKKMEKLTEDPILLIVFVGVFVFEAVFSMFLALRRGILKDRREMLMSKTNAELRSMLNGFNKISRLNKKQLVDMVVAYV